MSKSSSTNYPNGFLKHSISSSVYVKGLVDLVPLKKNQVKQSSLGGYSSEVPPLPIPNREVKLTNADGTAYLGGRVGSRLFKRRSMIRSSLFYLRSFLTHLIWMTIWLYAQYYPNRHSSLRHAINSAQIEKLRDRRSSLKEATTYSFLISSIIVVSELNTLCNRG